jgi:hypothetical protein
VNREEPKSEMKEEKEEEEEQKLGTFIGSTLKEKSK